MLSSAMPKLTDTDERTTGADDGVEQAAVRKLAAALDDDDGRLLVYMRIDNNRLEYTIINRPDPSLSGVTDAVLLSAILLAGRSYDIKREPKLAHKDRAKALRGDGSATEITYKDRVIIDFANGSMVSTRKRDVTLRALAIVVQNLSVSVARAQATEPQPPPN